ncbi:MAG: DUF481 domain-containing protein [Gemmatimonadaceae bacterium]|nr:DUF481 domain-containing protein [Gemmatimonadaceae bacterium]
MTRSGPLARALLLVPGLLCLRAVPVSGQAAPESIWERSVELSGNYLYGNTEQAILSVQTGVVRNDSVLALRLDTRFLIGVTDRADEGRVMDRRSWIVSTSLDFRQYASQSQFIFGSVERSLELRIDRRVSGGIGQKLVIAADSATRFDVSLGILGEQSVLPQAGTSSVPNPPTRRASLVRLSGRLRYRRSLTARLGVDHVTSYRPELDGFSRYLASSVSALSYSVGTQSHLRLSFQNDYDSLAQSRGSRSNQNGQILVGVSTKF